MGEGLQSGEKVSQWLKGAGEEGQREIIATSGLIG
jgi:hypothetical protein